MSWWKVLAFIAFIIGCIVCFFIVRGDDYSLATLKTENGYVVDIRAPYNWEMTQPISCRVMKNKEIIFPLRMIGTTHNARILEFALIESKEELVAVLEKTHPSVILAIYDLKNHTMWPSSEGWQQNHAIGQELLRRLDPNGKGFVLGSLDWKVM